MHATTIRRAILSALAASPLLHAGCNESAPPPMAPTPERESARGSDTSSGSPAVSAAPSASTSAPGTSEPPPSPLPSGTAPAPPATATAAASAPTPAAPEPPTPKPPGCTTTKAYCIAAHTPPPSFGNVPPPPPGSPDPTHYDAQGCVRRSEMPTSCSGMTFLTGPKRSKGECCYQVCQGPVPPCGRPFVVAGASAVAPATERTDWRTDERSGAWPTSSAARAQLREAWLADAAMEHASVASFARLALELLAFGAPPELVRGAHEAALDEVEHARLAYGIASALGERDVGPAPFPAARGAELATSVGDLVRATVRDGCVGETFAALVAAEAHATCVEPRSREVLARIAQDERSHAAYAFRVVAWAIVAYGEEARGAAEAAFTVAIATLREEPRSEPLSAGDLGPYGRLPPAALDRLAATMAGEVLAPVISTLLGARPPRSAPGAGAAFV